MTSQPSGITPSCPTCGASVEPGARFCASCGHLQITQRRPGYDGGARPAATALAPQYSATPQSPISDPTAAGPGIRCSSFLLDLAAMLMPALPCSVVSAATEQTAWIYVLGPVAFVVVWAWNQLWQAFTGRSFGKALLSLRLIPDTGTRAPGIAATMARSLMFGASLGLVGLPVLAGKPGLHDRLSGLTVIDTTVGPASAGGQPAARLRRSFRDRRVRRVQSPIPIQTRGGR